MPFLTERWGGSLDVGLYPSRERRRSNADTVDIGVFEARRLLIQEFFHLSKDAGGITHTCCPKSTWSTKLLSLPPTYYYMRDYSRTR